MNILIVSHYFWPENFRINDFAVALKRRGHTITVLTGIPNYPEGSFFSGYSFWKNSFSEEIWEGIRIVRSPLIPRGNSVLQLFFNFLSFVLFGCLTGILKCRERYDLILVNQLSPVTVAFPAILLKLLFGIPLIHWIQDLWPESLSAVKALNSKVLLQSIRVMIKIIYRNCDRILIQSRAFFPYVERMGVSPNRILYFPNSAEDFYRPLVLEKSAPEREMLPTGFIIIFAGNIGEAQDFPTILAAADILREYSEIKWVIIGGGRFRDKVEEIIRATALQNTVFLLNRLQPEKMPPFFSLADALLVTLRHDPIFALTIPSKVQSYLACGRPILASLEGEGKRVIEEAQAGLTCSPENPRALAEIALAMYRNSPKARLAMGEQGQAYFKQHFSRERLLDQLESIISAVVTCQSNSK